MKRQLSPLSLKAVCIGLLLIPANAMWQMMGLRWDIAHMSMISLLYNTVTLLFVLTIINRFAKKVSPQLSLSTAELLTIYVMLCLSTAIGGHMCVQILLPIISYAFAYATPENDWQSLFWHYIPSWASVTDKRGLANFFDGGSTFYPHLDAWSTPLLLWGLFLAALFSVMLSINFIFRRQWTENEKLSYPLIQLPLAMANPRSGFFRNKAMWIGFGVAAGIDLLNGINYLFPQVPRLSGIRAYDIADFFTVRPWNAITWFPIGIYPFAIGLAFFMPLELSFSCWFFYLYWQALRVLGSAVGVSAPFPYAEEQSFGAYLGIGVVAVWSARRYLTQVFRRLLGAQSTLDDGDEPISYRAAVIWMLLSMVFLVVFCYKIGMSLWVIATFFGLFFGLATGITRMRAELGSPVHDQHYAGPDRMMYSVFGAKRLGPSNLTGLAYLYFFNRAYDCLLMPHHLEGLKIAERADIENKTFAKAVIVAIGVSIVATIWAYLHVSYQDGVYTAWAGRETFSRLGRRLIQPAGPDTAVLSAISVGTVMVILLAFFRSRWMWIPFHPAGYAVTSTFTMNFFWFSLLVSFILKWIITKHGGIGGFRRAAPFFLGLVLGEFVVTTFWGTVAILFRLETYITINL